MQQENPTGAQSLWQLSRTHPRLALRPSIGLSQPVVPPQWADGGREQRHSVTVWRCAGLPGREGSGRHRCRSLPGAHAGCSTIPGPAANGLLFQSHALTRITLPSPAQPHAKRRALGGMTALLFRCHTPGWGKAPWLSLVCTPTLLRVVQSPHMLPTAPSSVLTACNAHQPVHPLPTPGVLVDPCRS